MIGLEQARAIELVEAHAWRDLVAGAPPAAAAALELTGREFGGAFALSAPTLESYAFNRVIGLGVARPANGVLLDAVIAHYDGGSVGFEINLCPAAEPADLPQQLAARGFGSPFHHVKWVRGIQSAPPRATTLRLERIKPRQAMLFASIAAGEFASGLPAARDWFASSVGRPGWTHYVTFDGEEAAGCAAMFVDGEAAWLGLETTRAEYRSKGSQSLLIAARIRDAAAAGCRWVTTDTGPNLPDVDTTSYRNMERAGFVPAYDRPCWIRV